MKAPLKTALKVHQQATTTPSERHPVCPFTAKKKPTADGDHSSAAARRTGKTDWLTCRWVRFTHCAAHSTRVLTTDTCAQRNKNMQELNHAHVCFSLRVVGVTGKTSRDLSCSAVSLFHVDGQPSNGGGGKPTIYWYLEISTGNEWGLGLHAALPGLEVIALFPSTSLLWSLEYRYKKPEKIIKEGLLKYNSMLKALCFL